nr:tRNA 4-thiouridine(8) synthase ThiI [Bacilli bacterium]
MKYNSIMIHYGELSTKGNNRRLFIQQLIHNVRVAIKSFDLKTSGGRDHIYVDVSPLEDCMPVLERLQEVSGIQRLTPVLKIGKELPEIKEQALGLMMELSPKTFKVESRRADKTYPIDSMEISRQVGGFLAAKLEDSSVDVHNPEAILKVNLREDACYLSLKEFPGIGGYPLGMNGKVTMLLSGGIDSPVAAYSIIRRGIKVECLHFASPPYTSDAVLDKLKDLLKELNAYQSDIKLDVVPFTKLQEAIYQYVAEPYCITIMRRMMVRIAVGVAKKNKCLAIATGESIGQVASQTLESLSVINEVTNFPVIRPLA